MYIPVPREQVEIAGRYGVFFVLSVDCEDGEADLVALNGHAHLLSNVPFAMIHPHKPEPVEDTSD